MSSKLTYLQLFGLKDGASAAEIKRAYRKLAMKYHPDRNPDPKAHQLFLDLTEAYQRLIDNKFGMDAVEEPVAKKEKSHEERIKEAKERYKFQLRREKMNLERSVQILRSGIRWKIFKFILICSTLISFAICVDKIVPTHFEKDLIVNYSGRYSGLENSEIYLMETAKGAAFYVASPNFFDIYENPEIHIERSGWMHNPLKIWKRGVFSNEAYRVDFSIINLFPLFSLFFLFPLATFLIRKKTYSYIILHKFSLYIVGTATLVVLFLNDRWLHLLTFGLL